MHFHTKHNVPAAICFIQYLPCCPTCCQKMDDKSIEMTSVEKMDYNAVLFRQTSRLQHQVLRHLCTWIVHTDVEKNPQTPIPQNKTITSRKRFILRWDSSSLICSSPSVSG